MAPSRREFLKGSAVAFGAAASGMIGADSLQAGGEVSKGPRAQAGGCPAEVRKALSGPWASVRTPFTRRGEIDYRSLYRMIDFAIEEGKSKAMGSD